MGKPDYIHSSQSETIIRHNYQNISSIVEETAAGSEEVTASAEEVTSTMDELTQYADKLNDIAEKLKEELNNFTL